MEERRMDSITEELCGIDLGDKRLNRRSLMVLQGLSVNTQASINGSFDTWADTHAAYRLFDNLQVTPEAILQPHYAATHERIRQHPVVLVVQDTTEFDFSQHPPRDAACLTKPNRLGFYDHLHLAVTPKGLPLGLVGTETFDRTAESLGRTKDRYKLPIEEKESFRWLKGFRLAHQIHGECPPTQIVSVADRDADIYDIFLEAQTLRDDSASQATDYVIRSKENRLLNERIPPREHNSRNAVYRKLRDETRQHPVLFCQTIELPPTPKRSPRSATCEVRTRQVTFHHPKNRRGLEEVTCQVVYVQEVDLQETPLGPKPEDNTLIEWWLLTSLPATTPAEVERIITYYKTRWTIEVYFRTLKTGCRVEQIQLETVSRVKNCLAFYRIIAWHVLWLTHLNRCAPDQPCTTVFADWQWQPLWRITTRKPLPPQPPTFGTIVRLLASLGGYNNRPKERPPGPQPLWIGIRRMHDFALAWRIAAPT
jgi:ADP-ribose pyrophosphatase YjhB (NUDIX family)